MRTCDDSDYLFAAWLADPSRNPNVIPEYDFGNSSPDVILTLFKHNKVGLAFLSKKWWGSCPEFFESPQFKQAYDAECSVLTNLRNEYAEVKRGFLSQGIEDILIKSVGSIPYTSDNLDVLVKRERKPLAESILRDLGYVELKNVEEPYKTLFRKFDRGKSTSVIHLHDKVAWINPFMDETFLWKRYRNSPVDDLIHIASREDSILILTAHWFYEDKEIKLSDIMKISSCFKEQPLDWNYMTDAAKNMGWLNGLYLGMIVHSLIEKKLYGETLLQNNHLEEAKTALPKWIRIYLKKGIYSMQLSIPFKLSKLFCKFLHYVKTLKDNSIGPLTKLVQIYSVTNAAFFQLLKAKWNLNLRYQPPMLIAFSGVDGSGKTTYAETLCDILTTCEIKNHYVWSRVASSSFIKPFSKTAKIFHSLKKENRISKQAENYAESEARRKDLFAKSPILRMLGLFILLLEMLWQYSLKVTLPLSCKKVVICDRYIYDTLVDILTRYGMNFENTDGTLFAKILTILTPKPDIAYLLHIPLKDACSRKDVDTEEIGFLKKQIALYHEMVPVFNLHEMDSNDSMSIPDISDKMINEVLISFYEKWYRDH